MSETTMTDFTMYENMILPPGSGHVVYIKRNANRPYCARRYSHTDEKGNPRNVEIGSFATRGEAIHALLETMSKTTLHMRDYNLTFSALFDIWYSDAKACYAPGTLRCYRHNFNQCRNLHHKVYRNITTRDMQRMIAKESSGTNQRRMMNLFMKLDHTAESMDIIEKRRSDYLFTKRPLPAQSRIPLSDSEVNRLLEHREEPGVAMALFLLYTGLRSGEVCELLKVNVDLTNMYLVGGKKTAAGCMRIIPIHPRIAEFVKARMEEGRAEYLFCGPRGGKLDQKKLQKDFKAISQKYCGLQHIPHECRHTFQTRLDMMHADRTSIDLLMGHEPANRMDKVYSHRSLEALREVIMLLW